jgi:F5/8 type C domain/PEP-CTERM motif
MNIQQLAAASLLSLAGIASATSNVALTGTASQSSNYAATTVAALTIDGNTDGNWDWTTNILSHTNNDSGLGVGNGFAWWEVALTADFNISQIVIWNRTDSYAPGRIVPFTVSILDGASTVWFQVVTGAPNPSDTFAVPSIVGDKVRVQLNRQEYLHMAEVQVMATPVPEPGTYALMAAGLAAVGFVARRRRSL